MAHPDNGHHVHDDGYRSDKGEPDRARMLVELADDVEQIDGVQQVRPEDNYVEVDYRPDYHSGERFEQISAVAEQFDCTVVTISDDDGLLEIRP